MLLLIVLLFINNFDSSLKSSYATPEYFIFLIIFIFSSFYIIFFKNIFTLWVALELQNMTIYALLAISSRRLSYFMLRYFFLSSFISLVVLFYLYSLLYYGNTIDFSGILLLPNGLNSIISILFIFKFGIFPFTFWLVEFYKSFSGTTLIFLVAVTKVPIFVVFTKFLYIVNFQNALFAVYLVIAFMYSFISMLSNIKNTRVFFAYSSSNVMTLLLLYVVLGGVSNEFSLVYLNLYFVYYIVSLSIVLNYIDIDMVPKNTTTLILFYLLFGLPFSPLFFFKMYMIYSIIIMGNVVNLVLFTIISIFSLLPYFVFIFNVKTVKESYVKIKTSMDLNIILFYIIFSVSMFIFFM